MEQPNVNIDLSATPTTTTNMSSSIRSSAGKTGTFSELFNDANNKANTSQYQTSNGNSMTPVEEIELTPYSEPTPTAGIGATNANSSTSSIPQMASGGSTLKEAAATLAGNVVSLCDRIGDIFASAAESAHEAVYSFFHGGPKMTELPVNFSTPIPTPGTREQMDTQMKIAKTNKNKYDK